MSFSSTQTIDSVTVPGVRFTVKRIGIGPRSELDTKTLLYRQRLRELELEYPPRTPREDELAEQLELAKRKLSVLMDGPAKPPEDMLEGARKDVNALARELLAAAPLDVRKKRQVLDEEYATVQGPIRLIWIQAGLLSIEGGAMDGMTAEQLLDFGPMELAQEIYEVLTSGGRLAGPDAKNSSSPGTSGVVEMPEPKSTTAAGASEAVGMPSETASAIFRNASIRD